MATKLHFRIFDSGIDFTTIPGNSSGMADKTLSQMKKISATAALAPNTSMAFMFGTSNYYGEQFDQVENKYYFGYDKTEVEAGDNVELSKTAFIGFYQEYNNQEEDFSVNQFSSILVPESFNLNQSHMITHPNTLTVSDNLTGLRELESRLVIQEYGTGIEQNIISILYTTFLQSLHRPGYNNDTVGPAFIPISNYNGHCSKILEWINNRHESFFECLSIAANKLNIKTIDLHLYVLLMSIYPENVEELPMSTIQSISLY